MLKKSIILSLAIMPLALFSSCPQLGPNRFQTSATLTSAVNNDGLITVTGSMLTFRRCTTYRIQFFGNPENRNPITEGADLLGSTTITTDNLGNASFTVTLPPTQFTDGFMSATATVINCDGSTGDTSMFSSNIVIS